MAREIGKIIRGESHVVYWVQLNNPFESSSPYKPEDSGFGNYVSIVPQGTKDQKLVGVIIDTMLIDRDALRTGPRLSPDLTSMEVLYPDFLDERIKIVRVYLIGFFYQGVPYHILPIITPNLGETVVCLDNEEIQAFHLINNEFRIGYYSDLKESTRLYAPLLQYILKKLLLLFPAHKEILRVLLINLEYHQKAEGGI